jgi:Bacterial SH3 domain
MRKIIIIIFVLFLQITDTKGQAGNLKIADSLFSAKKYNEAAKIYEKFFENKTANNLNICLKLAFIAEQNNEFPKVLYYLNYRYNLNSEDKIFDRLNEIALENKVKGYERSDLNFVLIIFQQYFYYFLFFFIAIGILILFIFYKKTKSRERISTRQKVIFSVFLVLLMLMINLGANFQSAVVNNNSYFRNFPSSASPIIGYINPGNKLNIFGERGNWLRVLWNKKVVYIKKESVWILP